MSSRMWEFPDAKALQNVKLMVFAAHCEQVGVSLPEPLQRARALMDAAHEAAAADVGSLLNLDPAEVGHALVDLSVRLHVDDSSTRGLDSGVFEFEKRVMAEAREASLPYLEQMIADLRPAFDEAAQPYVEGARRFGFTGFTTGEQVIDMEDEDAVRVFRATKATWSKLQRLYRFRVSMSDVFTVSPTLDELRQRYFTGDQIDYSACFAAEDNWSVDGGSYVNRDPGDHLDWFGLAAIGLSLNSPAEVRGKYAQRAVLHPTLAESHTEDDGVDQLTQYPIIHTETGR